MESRISPGAGRIERMVESYSNMLLRLALHYTKALPDAQDMVQNVFLQLVRKRPRFESRAHERAWLVRAIINACKNELNAARRRTSVPLSDALPSVAPPEPSPVLDAVRALPETDRAVVFLYYYEGFAVKEIAAMLGAPEGTVSARLHRARAKLRTLLKGEMNESIY